MPALGLIPLPPTPPGNPKQHQNHNSEQKEIRIHNEISQQQKSNENSENFLVNCIFIFAYDNNCLYWIENKLFLFIIYLLTLPKVLVSKFWQAGSTSLLLILSTGKKGTTSRQLVVPVLGHPPHHVTSARGINYTCRYIQYMYV